MGQKSKRKGKQGEREAAKMWAEHVGCTARRGVQFRGGPDSPDIATSIHGIHIEVKRTAAGYNVQKAIDQAKEDRAHNGVVPVALMRQDRGEWIVSTPLADLMALVDILASRKWADQ